MSLYSGLILCFALLYLLITTIILLRNRKDLKPLNLLSPKQHNSSSSNPHIAVCIPARNEESVIGRNLDHLIQQNYSNYSVWILDDESTDHTLEIVTRYKRQHPNLVHIIKGAPLPDGWLGKNWACHQLAQSCHGQWLLFIDADVWLAKNTLSSMAKRIRHYSLDAITVWPRQHLYSFAEKLLLPLMYYALVSALPATYVYRSPNWLPLGLKNRFAPAFSAACGQFIALSRAAYQAIGGHSSVRSQVVEDVALARRIKAKGYTIRMFQGNPGVHCRMYNSEKEIREGFRKNFLAGFNYNIPVFLLSAVVHLLVFVAPFLLFPYAAVISGQYDVAAGSFVCIALILAHRLLLSIWFKWPFWPALLHPLAVLWYQFLGALALGDYMRKRSISWKGRVLNSGESSRPN